VTLTIVGSAPVQEHPGSSAGLRDEVQSVEEAGGYRVCLAATLSDGSTRVPRELR
jgi:hypothetical protein